MWWYDPNVLVDLFVFTTTIGSTTGQYETPLYPESELLRILKLKHTLGDVPRDGNCFWHSCAELMWVRCGQRISHDQIRQTVSNSLTDMERSIVNEVDSTNSGWADHVELHKFATEFNVRVVVCDDDHGTITIHGPKKRSAHTFVLRLFECHYTPVFCKSVRLLKLFETRDCVSKDHLKRNRPLRERAWKFVVARFFG